MFSALYLLPPANLRESDIPFSSAFGDNAVPVQASISTSATGTAAVDLAAVLTIVVHQVGYGASRGVCDSD